MKNEKDIDLALSGTINMDFKPSPEFDKFLAKIRQEQIKNHEEMVNKFFQEDPNKFHSYLNVLPEFNSNHPGVVYMNKPIA